MHIHVVRANMVKSVPLLFDVSQRFDSPCLNCFNGKKGPNSKFLCLFSFLS